MLFKIETSNTPTRGKVVRFFGEVETADLIPLHFDEADRYLLDNTPSATQASQYLIVLSMLFRRYEELHEHLLRR